MWRAIESEARSEHCRRQLKVVEDLPGKGLMDEAFDVELLLLALLLVVMLPTITWQVVLLVTGQSADSDTFLQRWDRFVRQLADALGSRGLNGE